MKEGTDYITLQQLLQVGNVLGSGGSAKAYLAQEEVLVNGEPENRRGRKLHTNDIIETNGKRFRIQ